jgi:uncharacterized protein (TIGR00730 family)
MRWITVFCGSRTGRDPRHAETAAELGRAIGRRDWGLIYGGGRVGLMGILADAALRAGAPVVGVIPRALLEAEVGHGGLTELVLVETMHERKAEMARRADAFATLPGGIGTLDETFEILTWFQLGIHGKPIGVLNTNGYYDPLLAFLDRSVEEGFLGETRNELRVEGEVEALLDRLG